MAQQCPLCDTVNDEAALECERCGRQLLTEAELDETIERIPDLEETSVLEDTRFTPDVERMADVEDTLQAPVALAFDERIAVEPTLLPAAADGPIDPPPRDFESGRDQDGEAPTPAPTNDDACPFCGHASTSKLCESCGRRKARYTSPAEVGGAPAGPRRQMPTVLCPACLGRVIWDLRCSECGTTMAPLDPPLR